MISKHFNAIAIKLYKHAAKGRISTFLRQAIIDLYLIQRLYLSFSLSFLAEFSFSHQKRVRRSGKEYIALMMKWQKLCRGTKYYNLACKKSARNWGNLVQAVGYFPTGLEASSFIYRHSNLSI